MPATEKLAPVRRPVLVLVLLVALLALPTIATRELMPTDEPRFALVARQMVEDPAPIVPHLGYDPITRTGETYGDKPPVFFWLISCFSLLTGGVNEISTRLPSLLAALAAVLLTRRLGRLLADERTGFAAAAILATSNQFFLRAGWCSIDMLLTALVLATTYCWLSAARDGIHDGVGEPPEQPAGAAAGPDPARAGRALRLAALGGFFASVATLSKGPVGLIFPLAFLAGDRIAARRRRAATLAPDSPGAVARLRAQQAATIRSALAAGLCYLLPIFIWIGAIAAVGGSSYVREILFRQNVTRYVAAWNNEQPWYYYIYRLPIGLFPWTMLLPAAILAPRGAQDRPARSLRGLLYGVGALFVFFSVSTGKRGVYLLPLYPALAILLAAGWERTTARVFRAIAAVHMGALTTAGIVAAVILPIVASRKLPELTLAAALLGLMIAAITALAAVLFFKGRADSSLRVLAGGIAILVFTGSILLVPWANRRSGLRAFGAQLAAVTPQDAYLIVDREGYEQILVYSHLRGARRDFEHSRVSMENGSVVLAPTAPAMAGARNSHPEFAIRSEAERSAREVRFPSGARVVFVVRGRRATRVREALGPTAHVLFSAPLSDEPYVAIASR